MAAGVRCARPRLFVLWHGRDAARAAWRGFLFTVGTFLAGTYWLYHSIHLFGQAPVWVALLLMLGLVAIMGVYSRSSVTSARAGLPRQRRAALAVRCCRRCGCSSEWFRGWFLSGFPWLALGYASSRHRSRGFAPLLGVYGVSLAAAVTAGALVALLLGERRDRIVAAGRRRCAARGAPAPR